MEFQHREKQSFGTIKGKDLQIVHLHNQLILRDEIMKDQKNLLEGNKIKSNISYKKIKSVYEIEEEAKLAMSIQKAAGLPNKYSNPGRNGPQPNSNSIPIIAKALPVNANNLLGKKLRAKVSVRTRRPINNSFDKGSFPTERNRAKSNASIPIANDNYYFNKDVMYKCKKLIKNFVLISIG